MKEIEVRGTDRVEEGSMEKEEEEDSISLDFMLDLMSSGHPIYEDDGAKALADREMTNWFSPGGHNLLAVLFFLGIVGALAALALMCTGQKWRRAHKSFQGRVLQIARLTMLQQMMENIPMSQAASGKTVVVFRFNMGTIITFVVAQIIVFIVILVIGKIMGRILEYMWSDYLEQPSQYLW